MDITALNTQSTCWYKANGAYTCTRETFEGSDNESGIEGFAASSCPVPPKGSTVLSVEFWKAGSAFQKGSLNYQVIINGTARASSDKCSVSGGIRAMLRVTGWDTVKLRLTAFNGIGKPALLSIGFVGSTQETIKPFIAKLGGEKTNLVSIPRNHDLVLKRLAAKGIKRETVRILDSSSKEVPIIKVNSAPGQVCGPQNGHRKCRSGECCNTMGWCGVSNAHCVTQKSKDAKYHGEAVNAKDAKLNAGPGQRCGPEFKNAKCRPGECCSTLSWCGTSDAHCGVNGRRWDAVFHGAKLPPAPAPKPVVPVVPVTPKPTVPVVPVVQSPIVNSTAGQTCGPENGNHKCRPGECCSVFGWCGSGNDHCVTFKRQDAAYHGDKIPTVPVPVPVNTTSPVVNAAAGQTCGPDNGNRKCRPGECCSVFGWCGTVDHCRAGIKRSDATYDGDKVLPKVPVKGVAWGNNQTVQGRVGAVSVASGGHFWWGKSGASDAYYRLVFKQVINGEKVYSESSNLANTNPPSDARITNSIYGSPGLTFEFSSPVSATTSNILVLQRMNLLNKETIFSDIVEITNVSNVLRVDIPHGST